MCYHESVSVKAVHCNQLAWTCVGLAFLIFLVHRKLSYFCSTSFYKCALGMLQSIQAFRRWVDVIIEPCLFTVETGWKPSETEQRLVVANFICTWTQTLHTCTLYLSRTPRQIDLERDPERLTSTLRQILRQIKVIMLLQLSSIRWYVFACCRYYTNSMY